ncbi:MAG: 30S ribosomal protein S9 [bacterium]|nr:30S ribosomal protein S9 [bacterium]
MARTKAAAAVKYYGTGRRKEAIAKVWLLPGTGEITVNGKPLRDYVGRDTLAMIVKQPLVAVAMADQFNVVARTLGGGVSGQAGAIRHGIARALVSSDETMRTVLRRAGFLTRDPREKERKKYGLKRARKAFQFSKR